MKIALLTLSGMATLITAVVVGIALIVPQSYGERYALNHGSELYVTDRIGNEDRANTITFLTELVADWENEVSFQLDRDDTEYVLRMVVSEVPDDEYEEVPFAALEILLEADVFPESNVRVELTDGYFQTLRRIDNHRPKSTTLAVAE